MIAKTFRAIATALAVIGSAAWLGLMGYVVEKFLRNYL